MRELKFRVADYAGKIKVISLKQLNTLDPEYAFDKFMGQYTGLKDKNGTEIYEGDIVYDIELKSNFVVLYIEGIGSFALNDTNTDTGSFINYMYEHSIEILSNIYDHPELLNDR